jgi:hypothetical protein
MDSNVGRWSLAVGRWSLVVGRWLLSFGTRVQNQNLCHLSESRSELASLSRAIADAAGGNSVWLFGCLAQEVGCVEDDACSVRACRA